MREKEAELEELERKKHEKFLQMNEEKVKEAIAVETECEAIERACCILMVVPKFTYLFTSIQITTSLYFK